MARRDPVFQSNPRTQAVAGRLMADAMGEIAQGVLSGRDHHAERDRVLREMAPAWIQIAGRDAADAAVRGLHYLEPREYLSPAERRGLRAIKQQEQEQRQAADAAWRVEHEAILRRMAPHLLPQPRSRLRAFGMLILWLALTAGGLLAGLGYASAREAPSRWRALAACGVAKGADYERKCRQFSRTERSTWRTYDGPGAGAPRDWETPKAWE